MREQAGGWLERWTGWWPAGQRGPCLLCARRDLGCGSVGQLWSGEREQSGGVDRWTGPPSSWPTPASSCGSGSPHKGVTGHIGASPPSSVSSSQVSSTTSSQELLCPQTHLHGTCTELCPVWHCRKPSRGSVTWVLGHCVDRLRLLGHTWLCARVWFWGAGDPRGGAGALPAECCCSNSLF